MTRTCECKFVVNITCDLFRKGESRLFLFKLLPVAGHASPSERLRLQKDHSYVAAAIIRELAQDGICTTSQTVKRRIFAWIKGDGLEDRHRLGRPSSITK